jgi:hypothetical protein
VRGGLARSLTAAGTTLVLAAAGIAGAPPAAAATGDITTIAGGPGTGPALDLGQYPFAVAMTSSRIWVVDFRGFPYGLALRVIDRATGIESAPLLRMPYPTSDKSFPVLAPGLNGSVLIGYENSDHHGIVVEQYPNGQARVLAGSGSPSLGGVDGLPATAEALDTVNGLAMTAEGAVYLSENTYSGRAFDVSTSRIRKVGKGGRITTVVDATGTPGDLGDGGPGAAAQVNQPMGLALDPAGNLYIADRLNHRIRRLSTLGLMSSVATGDAEGVAYSSGALFFPDTVTCTIRRLDGSGLTTVAGNGTCGWSGDDGPALAARISPLAIAALEGAVAFVQRAAYLSFDNDANLLRVIGTDGTVRRLAGAGHSGLGGDGGPALDAQLSEYSARTAVDPAGRVLVADGPRLRRIEADGIIHTIAGSTRTPHDTGAGGPAAAATFNRISDVAVAGNGDIYLADGDDSGLYRIDAATGTITRLPVSGYPVGLVTDGSGALLFGQRCSIQRIDLLGVVTTVAGSTSCGASPDGTPAVAATLGAITEVALDPVGGMLFAEQRSGSPGATVRRVGPNGLLSTVAGGGTSSADGVPATSASVSALASLAVDAQGRTLLSEDGATGRVRRVEADGTITTIVGAGTGADGGPAQTALLAFPRDLSVDQAGNLLIACSDRRTPYGGGVIRKVSL